MFSSTRLFRNISCPRLDDCTLSNCIFSHQEPTNRSSTSIYDPTTAGDHEQPPPLKKRRIEPLHDEVRAVPAHLPVQHATAVQVKPARKLVEKQVVKPQPPREPVKVVSLARNVSPPRERQQKKALSTEKLIPRLVPKAPAILKTRLSLVELLYKHMTAHNQRVVDSNDKTFILSDQELIHTVLNEEQQAALNFGSEIYRNAMSQKVLRFKKLSIEDWHKYVLEFRQQHKPVRDHLEPNGHPAGVKDTKTELSPAQEIAISKTLRTRLEGLEQYGYVTAPPSAIELEKSKAAVTSAAGYEVCDRCGTRFQCFPGRDADGRLTTRGTCHYHWARIDRSQSYKNARMYGQADAHYPCCNQSAGSEGCTTAESHVFKVTDVKRLASLLQFESTPATKALAGSPVAFDCEMGYTTYGLELIRVTAVSWPDNTELLDVLVRPYGEVLDLNTRFSGVSQEQFAGAPAYDPSSSTSSDSIKEDKSDCVPLRKVDSPATARQLLFNILTPETPLVGHAIDNDLNACRMIHPFIIDTVLLYPHPRGLPIRYGLKMLTAKYLDRAIQTGGAQGHDSKEDSIATGDLVRAKVAERWAEMKLDGWVFGKDDLTAPVPTTSKSSMADSK